MRGIDTAAEGGFDMIFIDADKGGYYDYYEAALTCPGLLNEGGVVVMDNTLFKGQARHISANISANISGASHPTCRRICHASRRRATTWDGTMAAL